MEVFFNIKANQLCSDFNKLIKKLDDFTPKSKYLVIIACHLNSHLRIFSLLQNIKYLSSTNTDFLIVYSKGQPFNDQLLNMNLSHATLLEVENDYFKDFNKWYYGLKNIEQTKSYDYFVFTNDSYVIKKPMDYFYSFIELNNHAELISYCSSNEYIYHYQSFLFAIKSSKKPLLMTFIESFHGKPDNYKLLINMEIKLYYLFDQKVCLLNLGRSDINNKKNIFFHNPSLYNLLHRENVLPFVKLKMVDGKRKPIRNQWVQF